MTYNRRSLDLRHSPIAAGLWLMAAAVSCSSDATTTDNSQVGGPGSVVAGASGSVAQAGASAAPATAGGAGGAAVGTTAGSSAPSAGAGAAGAVGSAGASTAVAGSAGVISAGVGGSAGAGVPSAGSAGASGAAGVAAGASGSAGRAGAGAAGGGGSAAGAAGAAGGGAATARDYAQRGPFEVLTEKNVGETFRNRNVRDETASCRAFVGSISLPGEGDVDDELTNYPSDMDRQLYTLFRPKTLEEGKKYPVVTWGNGTCAHPLLYTEILEHLASHGIIVIATNATSVGSGTEMQRGLDYVLEENGKSGSPLYGKIDAELFGASGHSQGSSATVTVGGNARIKVTVPIQGAQAAAARALKGPTFLISGEKDTLVTPASVESAFNAVTVPAVYGMSIGQDHLMPGRMPAPILEALTSWFALHLLKDESTRPLFYGDQCGLCSDSTWTLKRRNL